MDLSNFDTRKACNDGAIMQVIFEGEPVLQDDGKPVTITFCGRDSDAFQKSVRSRADDRMQARQRVKVTLAAMEAETVETLSDCTMAWDGIVLDGEALPCTRANAVKLYTRFPWLREQADGFVSDRANFLKPSHKN